MRRIASLAALLLLAASSASAQGTNPTLINAAGATFPYPIYSKWFDEYHKLHPNIQINYQSIGSGGGISQLLDRTVDFGASDLPMTDQQLGTAKVKILHFPTVLGADVPTYNLPGITVDLKFTSQALAGIFLGKITKWNDPEIVGANSGLKLPAEDIVVVHRSDGSGTTGIWTDYLSKVSEEWRTRVGKGTSVNWPVGLGGKGNEGVAGLVKQTPYSMGYVELIYAVQTKLQYGAVRNSAGIFVKATLEGVSSAAASVAASMPDDFRVSITNPAGANAYPIAIFTWLLIPSRIEDPAKRIAIKDFLTWMMGPGQQFCEPLAYAKLPKEVIAKETKAIALIQ
jgi:phosphate transport system substrate-binding protein